MFLIETGLVLLSLLIAFTYPSGSRWIEKAEQCRDALAMGLELAIFPQIDPAEKQCFLDYFRAVKLGLLEADDDSPKTLAVSFAEQSRIFHLTTALPEGHQ
jgi:hypothetical protein